MQATNERVLSLLLSCMERPETIEASFRAYNLKLTESALDKDDADTLKAELTQIKTRTAAVVEAQIRAVMAGADSEVYESQLASLSKRKAAIEQELAQTQAATASIIPNHRIPALSAQIAKGLAAVAEALLSDAVAANAKARLILTLVESITVGETFIVNWRK